MNNFEIYIDKYFSEVKEILSLIQQSKLSELNEIISILLNARNKGKMIIIMGNGGSASTASHFASDLNKTVIVGQEKRFKAISLTDNMPVITAWSNDKNYEDIFIEQLKNFLNKDDIIIGISGSGKSKNVIKAIEYANLNQAITIGFTGYDGGILKNKAIISIIVPSNNMQQVEDVHMLLIHLISAIIRDRVVD